MEKYRTQTASAATNLPLPPYFCLPDRRRSLANGCRAEDLNVLVSEQKKVHKSGVSQAK